MSDPQPHDRGQTLAFLNLVYQPGDVFEVRVLGAERPGYRRPHVESGYFDHAHLAQVPAALAELTTATGVYVIPNPVYPALLARAANRIRPVGQEPTTSDADILVRRWLPVDCDPVRPAGIAATDDEHALALAKAAALRTDLAHRGWPEPIATDSGNGGQLLYRVELPANDGGLIKRCLQALAAAGDAHVEIDQAVHNAARLWRLPGTWNRKGDSLPARPHRLATILYAPAAPVVVPGALLAALAPPPAPVAGAPQHAPPAPPVATGDRPGDDYNQRGELGALLAAHGWQPVGTAGENQLWRRPGKTTGNHSATFNGHTFYVFSSNATPFAANTGYTPFAVYALLNHGGDFAAASAALATQGYGGPPPAVVAEPEVDLSALLGPPQAAEDALDREPGDPGRLPARLYRVPGFLDAYQAWVLATAPYPSEEATFAGGLTMLSWLTGRKIRTVGGLRTNLYAVVIAEAGVGKNRPREANAALVRRLDLARALAENIASAEALEDALRATPSLLWQCDEFDALLAAMAKDDGNNGGRWNALSAAMRAVYTASATLYACRRRARLRGHEQEIAAIDQPHLVVLATATPEAFFAALSEGQATNGLLARCLLLDAPGEARRSQRARDLAEIPEEVMRYAATWATWAPGGNLHGEFPQPAVVPAAEAAQVLLDEYREDCDRRYRAASGPLGAVQRAVLARTPAMAEKLALLFAASAVAPPATLPQIDVPAVAWGRDVADYLAQRLLWHLHRYLADGSFARAQQRLLRFLHDHGGRATKRDVARYMRATPDRTFEEVLKSLQRQERIAECTFAGRRKAVQGWTKLA